jgi:signal transduction histidine kinase
MNYAARTREGSGGTRRPSVAVMTLLAVTATLGAAGAIVLRLSSDHGGPEPGLQIALLDWIVLSYVFSGLVAWWRRPESRFGRLMVLAGFLVLLTSLSSANSNLPFTIGQALDLLPFAVFLHTYLAFPTGRLRGRFEVALVCASYVVAVGVQVLELMLGGFDPANSFAIAQYPQLTAEMFKVQLTVLAALLLGGIVLLAIRRRAEGRPLRRSASLLANSFAIALLMSAALLLMGAYTQSTAFLTVQRITFFIIGLAPIAFLVAILNARLARASVGELIVELRAKPAPGDIQQPLARALNDPSLSLAYWLPKYGTWADQDGRPVRLPEEESGRAVTTIDRDGQPLAALIHDASLADEPELLESVGAAAGIALENGQLNAELRASLEELKESRGRVITAGQEERKRLERNLHDGAQQRLIALSLELGRLEERLDGDDETREQIDEARAEIAVSLDELRDVARGLHPAVLTGHGLDVAIQSLAASSTVPVRLNVEVGKRLEERVEVAAYYVVSESLANIGKHAEARSATVEVARDAGVLVVQVVDDGIGGADSERGSGLRGLADRVEALGGRLRVWTPVGEGTTVRAEMPCA